MYYVRTGVVPSVALTLCPIKLLWPFPLRLFFPETMYREPPWVVLSKLTIKKDIFLLISVANTSLLQKMISVFSLSGLDSHMYLPSSTKLCEFRAAITFAVFFIIWIRAHLKKRGNAKSEIHLFCIYMETQPYLQRLRCSLLLPLENTSFKELWMFPRFLATVTNIQNGQDK